ncbi:MAG: type II toxin-antitoxin system VapC family toxin [Ardenticatenaceae bacterium]|nr:type II toxin-antitoxin system VapC family toxin [Ardenticatenaceae bacterium]
MILCDTNILIEFYKNNPQIGQIFRAVGKNDLAISVITEAELYFGALNKAELQMIKQHLSSLHRFGLDTAVSNQFLQLMETYSLSHKLSIPDALIAATALVHKVELFTFNVKDFHFIPNLALFEIAN